MSFTTSRLCGWLADAGATPLDASAWQRMLDGLSAGGSEIAGGSGVAGGPGMAGGAAAPRMAATEGAALAASGAEADVAALDGTLLVGVVGRPRFEDAQLAARASEAGVARAVAERWRTHGAAALDAIGGAWSLVVADGAGRSLHLAVDRMGQRPLTWIARDGVTAFGTSADALDAAFGGLGLDPGAVVSYFIAHMVPAPFGIFAGQRKLQAAELLSRTNGHTELDFHWLPHFEERADEASLREALHAALDAAVRDSLDQRSHDGAFLSGGLDSSTVAGVLRRVAPERTARTFSVGFEGADAAGYDELEYARITARHFGTEQFEHITTPAEVAELMPIIAASYDEPFGNSSAVAVHLCARLAAAHDVDHLLAGDGGDEIFAGNERYARELLLGLYGRLPGPARGLLNALQPALPKSGDGITKPLYKVRRYLEQARVPLPDRMQTDGLVSQFGGDAIFEPGYLEHVRGDALSQHKRAVFARPEGASDLNRMLYLDWQQTLADNDLRKVNVMSAVAGVRVSYPFLDDRVIEVATKVPSALKLKRGQLRYFYRRAMRGFLADATLAKSKHGFGLPFGVWLSSDARLRELSQDALASLASRSIFRADFLERLRKLHADDHASFYGEWIWVLVMLELWLARRAARPG